jgi:DNA-binding MarR family transcriptional regulator
MEGNERKAQDVAPDLARLYRRGNSYEEIGSELNLTRTQVHNILTRLFAAGLPKRPRHELNDKQVRAIHAAYLKGASIDELAAAIGFTGSAVRPHIHKLKLPIGPALTQRGAGRAARQQMIAVKAPGES